MIISRGDVSTSKILFFETTYLECAFLEIFVYVFVEMNRILKDKLNI